MKSLLAPFTTIYFYVGAFVTTALAIFEDQISDPLQRETIEARPLGHFATNLGELAGQMAPNVLYLALFWALGTRSPKQSHRAKVMAYSSIGAVIVANLIKIIVLEPRPDGSDHFSFPSGHSASAFSFAAAIHANHGRAWGVLAYVYALIVAYSRINDNRHYLHDVVGGAVVGICYGLAASDGLNGLTGWFARASRARSTDSK